MSNKIFSPCIKETIPAAAKVLKYLSEISGEKILTGQHTQTKKLEELHHIKQITGKMPALLGFELLSYSPNINYLKSDRECLTEVENNYGTLQQAWEWADKGGLITFTWHWFSPLYGEGKTFFTKNTPFDASRAVIDGTPERKALISDIDVIAGYLKPFCRAGIPILWRPLHECEGDWFWWGAKGPEVYKKLYHMLFDRLTNTHHLYNLIWVWNGTDKEYYPGDHVVDIISRDMYPEAHTHSAQEEMYAGMLKVTDSPKIVIIGETGTLPSPKEIHDRKTGWSSYMTWSGDYCMSENYTTYEVLREVYDSPYAVTLEEYKKYMNE